MKLNGKQFTLSEQINISDLLLSQKYSSDRVAVELNGRIVPKLDFSKTILKDSDVIEIVCFVGGG